MLIDYKWVLQCHLGDITLLHTAVLHLCE
uniref:Uncharacterized protein n=1 Tax=Anguilla anguilla TaxID=7936 RepID=A0A0E9UFF1_ANGAN